MTVIRHLYLHPSGTSDLARYLEALGEEIRLRHVLEALSEPLGTLLIGGGIPSLVEVEGVRGIRELVTPRLLDGIEEWTVEATPGDLTPELLRGWRTLGVTRPHLQLQSLAGPALSWLGRRYDSAVARQAILHLQGADFPTWGVDLFFGFPRAVDPDPLVTVREVAAARPPHISLYEVTDEAGDPFDRGFRGSHVPEPLPTEEEKAELYLRIATFLGAEGYEAYEMTGFALPGHRSRHATGILEGGEYLGVGPGAESFINGRLSRNFTDWAEYLRRLSEGTSPEAEGAELGEEELHFLSLWSRLRLASGVAGAELSAEGRSLGERWVRAGLARRDSERIALTLEGWLRLDGLAVELARTIRESGADGRDG